MLKIINCLFFLIFLVTPALAELPQEHFPVDDYMRPRVDFWKQVFSEVHSYEGLIHDDENLSIVYKKIEFNGKSRRQKIRYVRQVKREITRSLWSIIKKRKKNLTEQEEGLLSLIGDPPLEELRKMPH